MNGVPLPDRARWLLEACLRDDDRAVEAFGKWRRFANPDRMEGRELRLTPLLHANMRRIGLSDQKLAWIGGQAKHIWLTSALRRKKLLPVLDSFEGAGVDCVLIKGAALIARFPKAVGTRPMGDFDLLVHRSSALPAMAILNASGWRGAIGAAFSEADLNRYHAVGLWDPSGTCVDLHWRPAASIATLRHAEGVRERAVAGGLEGRPVLVASATDHLFILMCHAFHDDLERRSDWVADVDLLFRLVPPEEWDWRLFHRLAEAHQLDRWVRMALATTQAITGRPPPGGSRFHRAAPTWRAVLQDREIRSRGFPASSWFDRKARSNGRKARGFPGNAIDRTLEPARAVALALEGQALTGAGTDRTRRFAFPETIIFLEGWSFPEDGWRWTEADVCVFCVPVALGNVGEPFQMRMRLAALPELRGRLTARAWAGGEVETLAFRNAPDAEVFVVSGRLLPRTDGEEGGALGVLWLRLDGLFTPDERLAFSDLRRLGVRADQIEALLASEVAARLPTLDRPLPLGGSESDLMAWTGWGAPEGFGRWTVGAESRLRFRRPNGGGGAVEAVAIDVAQVFSAGGPVVFEIQVGSEAPGRFQFPDAAEIGRGPAPGGVVTAPLPPYEAGDAQVEISIRVRDPASPHELGLGDDRRKLGLAVKSIAPA